MNTKPNKIKCPRCGAQIDVNEVLYHQLEEKVKNEHNRQFASKRAELQEEKEAFEKQKSKYEANLEQAVEQGIQEKTADLEESLTKKVEEEHAEEVKALKEEVREKSEKVNKLNRTQAENERLKREMNTQKGEIELEAQRTITKTVNKEKARIRQFEEEKAERKITEAELKILQRDQTIQQQQAQLKNMQQKLEQGPVQLQGEVLELAIEDWLEEQFPLDAIEEIKKGVKGADCLQTVRNSLGKDCGTIYYESKRAKAFQVAWIDKFKTDIREKNANIGVLVTQTMPKDMDRFGLKDGIWICSFDEFKGLCHVFRDFLIQMSKAVVAQKNKGNKMAMLYDYLTSNEFRLCAEDIVQSHLFK